MENIQKLVQEVSSHISQQLQPHTQPHTQPRHCQHCPTFGQCIQHCPDKVSQLLTLQPDRLGNTLGSTTTSKQLASIIDHTLLKPEANLQDIRRLCAEAARYQFKSVCVHSYWVPACYQLLKHYPVEVCAVVGFPFGMNLTEVKAFEAQQAIQNGATEIDMVLNIGALKSKDYTTVQNDIATVVHAASPHTVKVILETALLTDEEKIIACQLAKNAKAHFVKTSTGFGPGGATAGDVALMRQVVGPNMGVKASGGVRNQKKAQLMITAGANRIGASASVKIINPP